MERPLALIVEDLPQTAGVIAYVLQREGIHSITAYDGEEALRKVKDHSPDIVILDIMLPDIDGFEVCEQIRRRTRIPVLMLTALSEDDSIIKGLEYGADDYLTKPFNNRVLALRVKNLLSRTKAEHEPPPSSSRRIVIDEAKQRVIVDGIHVHIPPTEFRLLSCLYRSADRVLSWESLLKQVWQDEPSESGREKVKVNVGRLRQEVELDPAEPAHILSVRGVGYMYSHSPQKTD